MQMKIEIGDLEDPRVQELVRFHQESLFSKTPTGFAFALNLDGLKASEVTFFAGWIDSEVAAIGAVKRLDSATAEIKSMRVSPNFLGQGRGDAMLNYILDWAETSNISVLKLETGTSEDFTPAINLYKKYGFKKCEVFGEYIASPHNQFFEYTVRQEEN